MKDLLNINISITYEETEDGFLFVGRTDAYPDVASFCEHPSEAYWLVVDAIRGLRDMSA